MLPTIAGTMISNIVRRGTRDLLAVPVSAPAARDSALGLAAMADPLRAVQAAIPRSRAADVALDQQECAQELGYVPFRHCREDVARHLLAERHQTRERRAALVGQIEPVRSPVVGMRPPFHQALLAQAVDEAQQRNRLNLEGLGHLRLGHAFLALEPRQRPPLRTGHAVLA